MSWNSCTHILNKADEKTKTSSSSYGSRLTEIELERHPWQPSNFILAGISAIGVTVITNPLDVVKTRMQLRDNISNAEKQDRITEAYRNVFRAASRIVRHDGILGLQKGISAAIAYQCTLNSLRLGLFDASIAMGLNNPSSVWHSFLWGGLGGVVGSLAASPFLTAKTRMQASSADLVVGSLRKSTLYCTLRLLHCKGGIRGLYRSVYLTIPKVAMSSGAQLASYAPAREYIRTKHPRVDQQPLYSAFLCGIFAGAVMAITLTPPDTILTRLNNQPVDLYGRGLHYSGVVDCVVQVVSEDGLLGLYRGFWPNQLRIALHTTLLLVFYDQLKESRDK